MRSIVVYLRVVVLVIIVCSAMTIVMERALRTWRIDVGTPAAHVFTATLREPEVAQIAGEKTTFQWMLPKSSIDLPPYAHAQIIEFRTMMRAESPPQQVTMTVGNVQFALSTAPEVRRYHVYAAQVTQMHVVCDLQGITDKELATLCVALDWVEGRRLPDRVDAWVLAWRLVLGCMIVLCVWVICTAAKPWHMVVMLAAVGTLVCRFPIQSTLYAPQLSLMCGVLVGVWWAIQRWVVHPWQRVASHAMAINMAFKGLGVLVPGYAGTDLFFHVHRFTSVMRGQWYMIADGQGQTYPYPPGVYQLLAPVVLPLITIIPAQLVMIASAVIIDSSTIMVLAWMCQRLGWSYRSIATMAWLYVLLPAGFLLQWQATISQTIGQWLGVMAIAVTLIHGTPLSLIWIMLAVVGHFGAFLTLHLAHTIAFVFAPLRRLAWWWWGVVGVMSVVFYSQYMGLIVAQIQEHYLGAQDHQLSWQELWWQFAWNYGIYGHYLGIGVALALIGIGVAVRDRWWYMAVAMLASTTLLLVAHVFGALHATRYVIFLFPVVASYAGITLGRLQRGRSGRVLVVVLLAYMALYSANAWFGGTIQGIVMGFLS